MLRALRKKYPKGSRLLWVCGDDVLHGLYCVKAEAIELIVAHSLGSLLIDSACFRSPSRSSCVAWAPRFDWISNEKGQAMLAELDGLIVQRRLHKAQPFGFKSMCCTL